MKLYTSTMSPFVRKVLVVAHEVGLASAITPVPVVLSPTAPSEQLSARNPLGKIPALSLDDGTTLYDSRVICEYLDSLHSGRKLIPEGGPPRFASLRRQALADGLLDSGILVRYETYLRPQTLRWAEWVEGQCKKVWLGLDALEADVESFPVELEIGQIAVACALGWLEFRKPLEHDPRGPADMRARAPKLFAWYERVRSRPSFGATEPVL